jgi:hypothetical protein
MRNEPMEPEVESQDAKDEDSNAKENHTGPAEEPRKESERRKRMTDDKSGKRVSPESPHAFSRWVRGLVC